MESKSDKPSSLHSKTDNDFMKEAFYEAQRAFDADEVPIGAVVVCDGKIIARAHNQVEMLKDPTAHAEMIATTQAAGYLKQKWLHDCSVYVTIEPCSMCAGALVLARIKKLVFGAYDPKAGACGSIINIADHKQLNHRIEIIGGILERECGEIVSAFFQKKRTSAQN